MVIFDLIRWTLTSPSITSTRGFNPVEQAPRVLNLIKGIVPAWWWEKREPDWLTFCIRTIEVTYRGSSIGHMLICNKRNAVGPTSAIIAEFGI